MPRRRDPLDGKLTRLCSLAELTVTLLRNVPRAREAFGAFRFDPDALADELEALAIAGRAAHSDGLDAHREADNAEEDARAATLAAYNAQVGYRERLAAAATVLGDPIAADDLAEVRRRLRLKSPRLTGALALYHQLLLHLEPASHAVHRHPVTAGLPDELRAHVAALTAALQARDLALRTRRVVADRLVARRAALRDALRRVRQMGGIAATRPDVPAALFHHLSTHPAPRSRRGSEVPDEGGATTPDPGAMPPDPGAMPPDPGATTPDPGATTPDPGAMPPDPGARPPPPNPSSTCPDDP